MPLNFQSLKVSTKTFKRRFKICNANGGKHDVPNLIMIGTPNSGSPLPLSNDYCAPAVYDIRPGVTDTTVRENTNTKYYAIEKALNTKNRHYGDGFQLG